MPPPNDVPDRTTSAISGLTERVIAYRGEMEMDRLSEKLATAAGAATRLSAKIEARADALIAREAIDNFSGLAVEGTVIRFQRHIQSAKVGDVLAEGQITIDVDAGNGFVGGVLRG